MKEICIATKENKTTYVQEKSESKNSRMDFEEVKPHVRD